MANPEHVAILKQGVEVWNKWREENPDIEPDLSGTDLFYSDLRNIDLHNANLNNANLGNADLSFANLNNGNLNKADLFAANLSYTNLTSANLNNAYLNEANCTHADFLHANLTDANISSADLGYAKLDLANLSGSLLNNSFLGSATFVKTILNGARLRNADLSATILIGTDFKNADISGCQVFGISAWDVETENLKQSDLIITNWNEPKITVDNIEIAQFVYLLLKNKKLRSVIDTLTTKSVLILGRFSDERKTVLDGIREALRKHDYVPMLFDFDKPANRDLTETVMTLASLSRFVIADLSDPNSIPHELMSFVDKLLSVPVQGIFCPTSTHPNPYPMYEHLQRLPHVLPIYRYDTADSLLAALEEKVIRPAEEKVKAVRPAGSI